MIRRVFSVAPMMDYTDRHCRYFLRLISKHAWLYTEMITTPALLHGDYHFLLKYDAFERPLALQLGGSDPKDLAVCAKMGEDFGYDEINLNVGCPSTHVTEGHFGACLMKQPDLVAECVHAMQSKVKIPVTIKTRIGVDEHDSYGFVNDFIKKNAAAGCKSFIFHARKAWLHGLSPKENRTLPPLHYETVYQIKKDFPFLEIIINGGIKTLDEAKQHLLFVDGVMIGREAVHNSYLLSHVDYLLYDSDRSIPTRVEILYEYMNYMREQLKAGVPLRFLIHPIFGLFQGVKGARMWRRYLTENLPLANKDENIIKEALVAAGLQ